MKVLASLFGCVIICNTINHDLFFWSKMGFQNCGKIMYMNSECIFDSTFVNIFNISYLKTSQARNRTMKIPIFHFIAPHTISATQRGEKNLCCLLRWFTSCTAALKSMRPAPYLQYCKPDLDKPLSLTLEDASEFSRDMHSLQQMCRTDMTYQESMCHGRTHRLEHAVIGSVRDFRNNE